LNSPPQKLKAIRFCYYNINLQAQNIRGGNSSSAYLYLHKEQEVENIVFYTNCSLFDRFITILR